MDVTTEYTRNETNQIQSYHYKVTLAAVGGTKKLGAGLRLADISIASIESVTFSGDIKMRNTLAGAVFDNVDVESGNEIVIPLFGDAHAVCESNTENRLLLNTGINSTDNIYTVEVIVTPVNKTQTDPAITKDNLDFFIAYGSSSLRTEVHIYEFANNFGATSRGNIHEENMKAAGKLTWGNCVPSFNYPKEGIDIVKAYPNFEKWSQDCTDNLDWYEHPTTERGKIYNRK